MLDRLRLLERRDIDELIILDIGATPNKRAPRFAEIAELCGNMFCPVTVGGGIRSVDDCRMILAMGADKVSIGTAALEKPTLIEDAAKKFGAQAIVVSIDVKETVWSHCAKKDTGRSPIDWARECEARGAGEILLTSIEQDGTLTGYDLDLILEVSATVKIPVIACGGCGTYEHMAKALNCGAHAVASGAMFQFRDTTPKAAARYLHDHGIPTRL
jgi:cyclase